MSIIVIFQRLRRCASVLHPALTLISSCLQCADHKVEALCEALQASVQQWRGRFPSPLPLELYTSSNFIGLFVEEQVADILKQFAADFAAEAVRKAGKKARDVCFLMLETCVSLLHVSPCHCCHRVMHADCLCDCCERRSSQRIEGLAHSATRPHLYILVV